MLCMRIVTGGGVINCGVPGGQCFAPPWSDRRGDSPTQSLYLPKKSLVDFFKHVICEGRWAVGILLSFYFTE